MSAYAVVEVDSVLLDNLNLLDYDETRVLSITPALDTYFPKYIVVLVSKKLEPHGHVHYNKDLYFEKFDDGVTVTYSHFFKDK